MRQSDCQWASDPMVTNAPEVITVPRLLPLDREISKAHRQIDDLARELSAYRLLCDSTAIYRLEKRVEEFKKTFRGRLREIFEYIGKIEHEWTCELRAEERRQLLLKHMFYNFACHQLHLDSDARRKPRTKHPGETQLMLKCMAFARLQTTIRSSLSSAIEALDEIIRFPGVFGEGQTTSTREVIEMRNTLDEYLKKLRNQLQNATVVGTPHMNQAPSFNATSSSSSKTTPTSTASTSANMVSDASTQPLSLIGSTSLPSSALPTACSGADSSTVQKSPSFTSTARTFSDPSIPAKKSNSAGSVEQSNNNSKSASTQLSTLSNISFGKSLPTSSSSSCSSTTSSQLDI